MFLSISIVRPIKKGEKVVKKSLFQMIHNKVIGNTKYIYLVTTLILIKVEVMNLINLAK